MMHNTDPAIAVVEYCDDNTEREHRVIAWKDDGKPLIVGLRGLEVPKFRAWCLDDETVERTDVERRVRRGLAEGKLGR